MEHGWRIAAEGKKRRQKNERPSTENSNGTEMLIKGILIGPEG
jgi:hypothetical protein